MKAINNTNLVDGLCGNCSCAAFTPSVQYTIGANNIVFAQSSTFDAGDSFKRLVIQVYDKNGKQSNSIMSGAGTGATATAVLGGGGAIAHINVDAAGSGYTVPPRVEITGGAGTGATAKAVINALGEVVSVEIIDGGTGYAAPTVTFITTEAEVSLIGMDMTKLQMKATLISKGGCKADLAQTYMSDAATSGNLGNINKQGDNNEAGYN